MQVLRFCWFSGSNIGTGFRAWNSDFRYWFKVGGPKFEPIFWAEIQDHGFDPGGDVLAMSSTCARTLFQRQTAAAAEHR